MKNPFKLWSQTNPEVKEHLSPELGLRNWDELTKDEKTDMSLHFHTRSWFQDAEHIPKTIFRLNDYYKKKSYGRKTLEHKGPHFIDSILKQCCIEVTLKDFQDIFLNENSDVIYEMLSIFANTLIDERALSYINDSTSEETKNNVINAAFEIFDEFKNCFNNIMEQYEINIMLTHLGLVFRQDNLISEEIYQPVIDLLSNPKWKPVNRDLGDAFKDYQLKKQHRDIVRV